MVVTFEQCAAGHRVTHASLGGGIIDRVTKEGEVERKVRDVTAEYDKMVAELMLIRVTLGLSPVHDVLASVRKLYEDGRDEFEKFRGPKCGYAHEWLPRR